MNTHLPPVPDTAIGFKEWAFICDALTQGVQSLILRKGGIHEGRGGFEFKNPPFSSSQPGFTPRERACAGSPRQLQGQAIAAMRVMTQQPKLFLLRTPEPSWTSMAFALSIKHGGSQIGKRSRHSLIFMSGMQTSCRNASPTMKKVAFTSLSSGHGSYPIAGHSHTKSVSAAAAPGSIFQPRACKR